MRYALLRHDLAASIAGGFLSAGVCLGQATGTGAISGIVYAPASRTVASADVLAVDNATHLSRAVRTTPEGIFRVPLLPPGTYDVTVKVPGYETHISTAVQVTVSETSSLTVTLAVAGAITNVQVSGRSDITELESSTLGGLVNERAIRALPLSSRNYTQILGLSPGVIADLPTATVPGNGTQNVTSNGATPTANNVQFNGIDANNLQENSPAVPAPDAIAC